MGKGSQLAEDVCFLQSPGRAFLAFSGATRKRERVDWGWLGIFLHSLSIQMVLIALKRPPKDIGEKYQDIPAADNFSLTHSCRSGICFRLIAFPRSSFSCADSSDAQMDKTFPEHLRQELPTTPVNASFQMCQLCWRTGRGKDPALGAGGICYQMTLPPRAKKNRKKKKEEGRGWFYCQQPLSPSSLLNGAFLWGGRIIKFVQREEIKQPNSQQ